MKTLKAFSIAIILALVFAVTQAATVVKLAPEYFPNPTVGKPISSGEIYIGVPDLDPEIFANRITVTARQESGAEVTISQPIETGSGGVPLYLGSPVTLIVDEAYSLKVLDSSGTQVYYVPNNFVVVTGESGVYLSDYSCDLATAVASIGAVNQTTLNIDCDCIIADGTTVTVTGNISLNVPNGGSFDGVSGGGTETIAINGPYIAGKYETFLDNLVVAGTMVTNKIYLEWFGWDGSGSSDDIIPFQRSLDLAESSGSPVEISAGTVLVDSVGKTVTTHTAGVSMASDVELSGVPGATIKAGANLPLTAAAIINKSGDVGLDVLTDSNISIKGIIFDGSGRTYPAWDVSTNPPTYGGLSQANAQGSMVELWSVDGVTIEGCEFKDHASLTNVIGGCYNVVIEGNYVHDCGKIDDVSGGFWISKSFPNLTNGKNIRIIDNTFLELDRLPFLCGGGVSGVEVIGNYIDDVKESGMFFSSGISNVIITGNIIENVSMSDISASGIEITDGINFVISGNRIGNTGRSSIASVGLSNSNISGNVFKNYGQTVTYPGGPGAYAAGLSGTMADEFKNGIMTFTGGTSVIEDVLISSNKFLDDQVAKTGKYAVYLSQYLTSVTYGTLTISGNDFRSGATITTIGYNGIPSTASTDIYIKNNQDSGARVLGEYGYPVQNYQLFREGANTGNDTIGNFLFVGDDDADNRTVYASVQGIALVATSGSEQGKLSFQTTEDGTITERGYMSNGMVIGTPTGGDKGSGTINAENGVYDNNVILTDYVYQAWIDGFIDDRWKTKPAELFKDMLWEFDIDAWATFQIENEHLPAFQSEAEYNKEGALSTGDMIQRLQETIEVMSIHIIGLNDRLKKLE